MSELTDTAETDADATREHTLGALRDAFDRQFASAPPDDVVVVPVLAITVADHGFAVPLASIAGLFADLVIVPYGSERSTSLGLVGVRGAVIAVHDLASALGYTRVSAPRWILLTRGPEPLALAFERFDAQLRLLPEQVIALPNDGARAGVFGGAVLIDGTSRPLLDVEALARALES